MQFTKRLWKNKPDGTTPIDAANLNRIETGLADAADELGTKANAQAVADALAGKLSETTADTRYAPFTLRARVIDQAGEPILTKAADIVLDANGEIDDIIIRTVS